MACEQREQTHRTFRAAGARLRLPLRRALRPLAAAAAEHGVLKYAELSGSGSRSGARQCESALMI